MTTYEQEQRAALEAMDGMPENIWAFPDDGICAPTWSRGGNAIAVSLGTKYTRTSVMNEKLETAWLAYDLCKKSLHSVMEKNIQLESKLEAAEKALQWAKHRLNYAAIERETFGSMKVTPVDDALSQIRDTKPTTTKE